MPSSHIPGSSDTNNLGFESGDHVMSSQGSRGIVPNSMRKVQSERVKNEAKPRDQMERNISESS